MVAVKEDISTITTAGRVPAITVPQEQEKKVIQEKERLHRYSRQTREQSLLAVMPLIIFALALGFYVWLLLYGVQHVNEILYVMLVEWRVV